MSHYYYYESSNSYESSDSYDDGYLEYCKEHDKQYQNSEYQNSLDKELLSLSADNTKKIYLCSGSRER